MTVEPDPYREGLTTTSAYRYRPYLIFMIRHHLIYILYCNKYIGNPE